MSQNRRASQSDSKNKHISRSNNCKAAGIHWLTFVKIDFESLKETKVND